MVKFSRTKIIAFDIDEALSFEGESGPYLQYAAVRAGNIFTQAARSRAGRRGAPWRRRIASLPTDALASGEDADALWDLVLACGRLDEIAEAAVRTLEPSVLAKYAFGLAQAFSGFYHRCPILSEERAGRAPVARRRSQLLPAADDARARPDGRRRAGADVMRRPRITYVRCSRDDDYLKSLEAVGVVGARRRRRRRHRRAPCTAPTASCWPAARTSTRRSTARRMHPSCSAGRRHARRVRARGGAALPARRRAAARRSAAACRCSTSRPEAR